MTAISPELSDVTVDIKDIVAARSKRKQQLKNQVSEIKSVADTLLEEKAKKPAKKVASRIMCKWKIHSIT